MKEFSKRKQFRKDNKSAIKKDKRKRYLLNRDLILIKAKAKREKINFDGLRQATLKRDSYQCILCGATKNLVVHHKDKKGRRSKIKNNILSNLITLCKSCHIRVHKKDLLQKRKRKLGSYLKRFNRWSFKYKRCINCGTRKRRHVAKGLCTACYVRPSRQIKK